MIREDTDKLISSLNKYRSRTGQRMYSKNTRSLPYYAKQDPEMKVFIGPSVEGGDAEYTKVFIGREIESDSDYVKVASGPVINKKPTFAKFY